MASVFSWREAIQRSSLKPTTRHVLLNLSTFMDEHGQSCYPSIKTQHLTTGLSEKCIINHLQLAEAAGFLVKRLHKYAGQQWRRNEYMAVFPTQFTLRSPQDYPENQEIEKGSEGGSVPLPEGGEPQGGKVVKEVHTTSSENSPKDIDKKTKGKKGKPQMVTLAEWEATHGMLKLPMVLDWARVKGFDAHQVALLIEEFRIEMGSKGKLYADFRLAFMTYLTKGYLSKRTDQIPARANPGATTQSVRGHSL